MKRLAVIIALACLLAISCLEDSKPPTEPQNSAVESTDSLIAIAFGSSEFNLIIPKSIITEEFKVQPRPNFGDVSLFGNSKFNFTISQEDLNLMELKSELESGGLFTFKFYDESDDILLYQSILPDGTELGYHLVQKKKLKGTSYIIRSNPQSEFSLQNVRSMQKVIHTLH